MKCRAMRTDEGGHRVAESFFLNNALHKETTD